MSTRQVSNEVIKRVLPNNLTVLIKEDHSSPVVAINIWIGVGSVDETEKTAGLAHFQEHMVFKGTEKYGVGEIANLVKSAGGNLNAGTSYSYTMYYVVLPSRSFPLGLAVQADAMMNSAFDPVEFKKERIVVIDEARMYDDQPDAYTFYRTMELGFKVHNYRRPIAGYERIVRKIKRDQLLDFYYTHYRPSNAVLVVVGDVRAKNALSQIEEIYGGWEDRHPKIHEHLDEPAQETFRFKLYRGSIDHAYLGIGFHIPNVLHEDYPALEVLSALLGSGRSSRLYLNVLEGKRLVTTIRSEVLAEKWPGFFQVYASAPRGKWEAARDAIFDELERFKLEPVDEEELLKARRQLQKSIYSELETMEGQASNLGYYELLGDYRLAEKHREAIRKVTAGEVAGVAAKYLTLDNCSLVAYLPEGAKLTVSGLRRIERSLRKRCTKSPAFFGPQARRMRSGGSAPAPRRKTSTRGRRAESQVKLLRLDNGVRVIVKRRTTVPLIVMFTVVQGGSRLEPKGKTGLSLLTTRSLLKGTDSYAAEDIARGIEGLGGYLESFSSFDTAGIYMNILSDHLEDALPIYGEIIRHPVFDSETVEREKQMLLEELAKRRDNPVLFSIDRLFANVFGDHPYSAPFHGNQTHVKQLTNVDCMDWHARILVPGNIVLCFVGDITQKKAMEIAENLYGAMKPRAIPRPIARAPEGSVCPGVHELTRRDIKQSVALVGFTAPPRMSRDAISLEVLNGILTGLGGRLFVELRDKRSLGYMTGSTFLPLKERSIFFGYANPTAEGIGEALDVIIEELQRVTRETVSDDELNRSKEWLIGTQIMELQTNLSQAIAYGTFEVLGFGYETIDRRSEMIQSVTKRRIQRAASAVFDRERAVFVKLTPG